MFITLGGSLFFLMGGIIILYPHNREYLLSKVVKNYLNNLSGISFHFDNVQLNLWDFSIHMQSLHIDNPTYFPDEPAIDIDHIQTKFYIAPKLKLTYKIYINNLQINLYHLPGKGTNIGTLSKILKKEVSYSVKSFFSNINSISTKNIEVVITQNIEPMKIQINTPQNISCDSNSPSGKDVLQNIFDSFLINNKDIPEDFRTSLIKEMEHNTI